MFRHFMPPSDTKTGSFCRPHRTQVILTVQKRNLACQGRCWVAAGMSPGSGGASLPADSLEVGRQAGAAPRHGMRCCGPMFINRVALPSSGGGLGVSPRFLNTPLGRVGGKNNAHVTATMPTPPKRSGRRIDTRPDTKQAGGVVSTALPHGLEPVSDSTVRGHRLGDVI